MDHTEREEKNRGNNLMKYGMWLCCAVMLLPIAVYFVSAGTLSGLTQNATVFAPLVLCVGAHLVMHKFMGKSCHSDSAKAATRPKSEPGLRPGNKVGATE